MSLRHGYSEYYDPAEDIPRPVHWARHAFLSRMQEVAPEVTEDLRDRALSLFKERYEELAERRQPVVWVGPAEPSSDDDDLSKELLAWATDWGLRVPWVLDAALSTLGFWTRRMPERLVWWVQSGVGRALPVWRDFAGWDPLHMTWKDFERATRKDFEEALEEHRKSVEAEAQASGYKPTNAKNDPDPLLHFDWFIHYQVLKWSYSKIAHNYTRLSEGREKPRAHSTVREAVRKTSSIIDLPLRSAN